MARRDNAAFDVATLQQAVICSRKLQITLLADLERIAARKAANRSQAAEYTRQLLLAQHVVVDATATTSSADSSTASAVDSKRKWTRRFFVDAKGNEPGLNADTVRRRAMEGDSFFYHRKPPWSKKESKDLLAAVAASRSNTTTTATTQQASATSEGSTIDFSNVASLLLGNRKPGSTSLPRTPEECQIHHRQLQETMQFSKQELQKLSEKVAQASTPVDWDAIAESLSRTECQRTAWDCLVAYHTKVGAHSKSSKLQTTSSTWTVQEDELLLKFLAAAGPQAVVESKNALVHYTILNQLLTTKSKKQIYSRANQSLLNPNLKRSEWSDEEERRLPIFMKIYHRPEDESLAMVVNPLFLASTHCYGRGTKSVVDKWNRSINPEYSSQPFTQQEDEALMRVMRETVLGWTELTQLHFPDRHPQRLQSRWSELASDQDILDRERELLVAGPPAQKRKRKAVDDVEGG
jgi:hypothetical protein